MKDILIKAIVMLLGLLTPDMLRSVARLILDWVKAKVLGSASKVDDKLVLPIIDLIEEAFNIPD